MSEIIRIFIIDSYSVVTNLLKIQLEQQADMKVVGDGEIGSFTLDEVNQIRPDVILMDLDTQFERIIDMARQMRDASQNIPIIFLSLKDEETVRRSFENLQGVSFVLKRGNSDDLISKIRQVSKK